MLIGRKKWLGKSILCQRKSLRLIGQLVLQPTTSQPLQSSERVVMPGKFRFFFQRKRQISPEKILLFGYLQKYKTGIGEGLGYQ